MSKWISVKDRLPPYRKNVLVYCFVEGINNNYADMKPDFIRIASLCELIESNGDRISRWVGHQSGHNSVSYWMPLPEIPVKELAKNQPCGCVVCTCDEFQCQGCGAHHCGTHPVGKIPNPVYK